MNDLLEGAVDRVFLAGKNPLGNVELQVGFVVFSEQLAFFSGVRDPTGLTVLSLRNEALEARPDFLTKGFTVP